MAFDLIKLTDIELRIFKKMTSTQRTKFCRKKTRVFWAAHNENFVILACITDRRTDRQTNTWPIAKTREAFITCCRA